MKIFFILFLFVFACEDTTKITKDAGTDADSGSDITDIVDAVDITDTFDCGVSDASDASDASDGSYELEPVRYRSGRALSPVTPFTVQTMKDIIASNSQTTEGVFMKAGASGTVSTNLLHCFSGGSWTLDLDTHTDLMDSILYYRGISAVDTTPFDRVTYAAMVGRTASWVMSGDPSPFDQEVAALNPRYAIINYGTNDMGMGTTYLTALFPFVSNMTTLIEHAISLGIVPVITGLNPRSDSVSAARWAKVYNDVTRALAEKYQVPYIDMIFLSDPLADHGLLSDGIHGNVYRETTAQPCVFTAGGLEYNYNNRNLQTMIALDYIRRYTILNEESGDLTNDWFQQTGVTPADPIIVDALPFSHHGDTSQLTGSYIDSYPECDSGQDESGPEYFYELVLTQDTPLRIFVFDDAAGDIDIHITAPDIDSPMCRARNDRSITGTLSAGRWWIIADTFVSSSGPKPGPFTIVISPCESSDPECTDPL
ncbi:SGNH/GDSL hydrolase family protein [Myxococcota bacterium]|nr:SGNH/GDSL hydrolase family protein [Myxococcota bacterium]MBU1496181.1 SGNH/GDSL hydrolase family protein [Myxococcota bacterium]